MADIFLSYSREDIDRVRPLVAALEKEGFSVWWDGAISPGQKFEETIDREIQLAACVLVVWSEASIDSQWVKNEALEGMDRDVLVPILIDTVRLPVAFKQHQIADFTLWPGSIDQGHYQKVIDAISVLVNGEAKQSVPVKGLGDMAPRGRRRYRRKRDVIVPLLIVMVVALSLNLIFNVTQNEEVSHSTRLTIDRFDSDGSDQSDFYADSISRELQVSFGSIEDLELVQVSSLWDIDLIKMPDVITKTETDYSIGGRVEAVGDRVTLNIFLRDAPSGRIIWQEDINDPTSDLIDIQQRIVKAVLGKLKMANSSQASLASFAPATSNKLAYRDYLLGQDLLRNGDDQNLREAIGRFEAAHQKDGNFILAVASACRAYIELFKSTKAAEDFTSGKERCEQVLSTDQNSGEVHLALGELYSASGDIDAAKLEYLDALKLSPGNPDASIGLASVLVRQGNLQGGEELYLQSVRENPTYWKAHNSLGTHYFRHGMYNRAIESYSRVTQLVASNVVAFINLGAAQLYSGDFDGAFESWGRANELERNSGTLSNLGTALYYAGRFEEALVRYQSAIDIDPVDHRLWGNLGDNLRLLPGRMDEAKNAYLEAISLAEAVIEVNPDDAYTLSRLAVYYAATGDADKADGARERAEILAGFDLNVLYDLAVASVLLGQNTQAQAYVSRALNAGYPAVLVRSDPQLTGKRYQNNE
jgi:tetratricopeptide (TPR) repeat protein